MIQRLQTLLYNYWPFEKKPNLQCYKYTFFRLVFESINFKATKWSRVKGLKVDIGKTKVMISGRDLHTLQTSDKYPYAVFRKGVRKTSIFCSGCSLLVHRKCSNIPGRLSKDPDFTCGCLGNAKAIDERPCVEVQLADGKVADSCYSYLLVK